MSWLARISRSPEATLTIGCAFVERVDDRAVVGGEVASLVVPVRCARRHVALRHFQATLPFSELSFAT